MSMRSLEARRDDHFPVSSTDQELHRVLTRLPARAVRRPRCRRPQAGRVVRPTRAAWCDATLAKRIRWREELVLVLRASKLAVAWIVCLDALPALGSHAPAIDSLRDLVFGLGLLNTLAAVGLEFAEATT